MLPGRADLSYEERLKKLDLPTLVFRRMRGDMIQVYKYLHELYDVEHEDILPRSENISTRGHHLKLKVTVTSVFTVTASVTSVSSLESFKRLLTNK